MKKNGSDVVTKVFLEIKLDKLKQEIDDKAQKYRDQILTSNDKLAKTLEEMRDENTIGFNQVNRRSNDHEKRIKKLEHIQQSA